MVLVNAVTEPVKPEPPPKQMSDPSAIRRLMPVRYTPKKDTGADAS